MKKVPVDHKFVRREIEAAIRQTKMLIHNKRDRQRATIHLFRVLGYLQAELDTAEMLGGEKS